MLLISILRQKEVKPDLRDHDAGHVLKWLGVSLLSYFLIFNVDLVFTEVLYEKSLFADVPEDLSMLLAKRRTVFS